MGAGNTTQSGASDVPDRFAVDFTGLTLLGIYRVIEKLADGGMGSIYLGEDTNLGRRVVIKVPHVRFLGEEGFRGRFRREIEELVRLEHPHIVRILAQGEHEDVPFFVLQYLGGGSLEDVFEKHGGPFEVAEILPWLDTIGSTLDFVHARGTVHRDVKPANVLFDEDGHVYLSDFGVAKALESQAEANLTEAGTGVGSPRYMAPEQTLGGDLSPAADVYALGSMVFEALSGRPPYLAEALIDTLVAKKTEDAPTLFDVAPAVDRPVSDVVARALRRDPAERHASCGAFAAELAAAADPVGVAVAEITASRTPLWIAGGLLLALLGVLVGVLGGRPDQPLPPSATDEVETARIKLIKPGAEPRRALRYVPAVATESFDLRIHQVTESSVTEVPAWAHPVQTFKMRLETEPAGSAGNLPMRWAPLDMVVDFDPEAPAMARELTEKMKPLFLALRGEALLSPNGLPRTSSVDALDREVTLAIKHQYATISWLMRGVAVPFPSAPVGVGAEWEITESGEINGIHITHSTRCHLRALDDRGAELQFFIAQTASRQTLMVAGDLEVTVKSLVGSGQGTAIVHFNRLVPQALDYDVELTVQMQVLGADGKPFVPPPEVELKPGQSFAGPFKNEVYLDVGIARTDTQR